MQDIATQIFLGFLIELIILIAAYLSRGKQKVMIIILIAGTIVAALIAFGFNKKPSPVVNFGNLVFDVNFSNYGDGVCNDYKPSLLGYDLTRKLYYIIPGRDGYISVCHENNYLQPQGILQATAFIDSDIDYFGYAIFFGWQGEGYRTTDVCGFGVRKKQSTTEAFFVQKIRDQWTEPSIEFDNIIFDKNSHSILMVLYPSGKALGYLDGNYIAEYSFINCQTGPIGIIAYGPGNVRVNFTNLKLYTLP